MLVDEKAEGDAAEGEDTKGERDTKAEDVEAEVMTTLPVQGVDDSQDAATAAPSAPADGPAANPQASVQLTKGALDTVPGMKSHNKVMRWPPRKKKADGMDEDEYADDDDVYDFAVAFQEMKSLA